jgi:hypothetical protein
MDYLKLKDAAQNHLKTADHLLTMTYPLVNDTKLLKLVFRDIHLSLENMVAALLAFKGIRTSGLKDDLEILKPVLRESGISQGYISFLAEFESLVSKQKGSDVEFIRKEKFVFASPEYELDYVNAKYLKDAIMKGKLFLKEIVEVIK